MSKKGRSLREALKESQRTILKLKAELAAGYMVDRGFDPEDLTHEQLARRYDARNFGRRTEAEDAPLYPVPYGAPTLSKRDVLLDMMVRDTLIQNPKLLDGMPVIGSVVRLTDDVVEAVARARPDEPAVAEPAVGHWRLVGEVRRKHRELCACGKVAVYYRPAVFAPHDEPCRCQFACGVECIERKPWLGGGGGSIRSAHGESFWFDCNSPCTCCRKCGAPVPCAESYTPDGCAGRCFCGVQDVEGAG